MTDKQIIIDGFNLEYIKGLLYNGQRSAITTKIFEEIIEELERKEQECEKLRGDLYFTNEQLKDFKSHYDKVVEECENLREKYLGLKGQKGSYIVQLNTVNEQLDQLKAENENWQKEYWKLEQGNDFLAEKCSLYKQTLTEIKEIAKPYYTLGSKDSPVAQILQKISEVEE